VHVCLRPKRQKQENKSYTLYESNFGQLFLGRMVVRQPQSCVQTIVCGIRGHGNINQDVSQQRYMFILILFCRKKSILNGCKHRGEQLYAKCSSSYISEVSDIISLK